MSARRALDQCLALLRSGRDENKLVGLMIAPRVLDEEGQEVEVAQELFTAVGPPFIARMLRTRAPDSHGTPAFRCLRYRNSARFDDTG